MLFSPRLSQPLISQTPAGHPRRKFEASEGGYRGRLLCALKRAMAQWERCARARSRCAPARFAGGVSREAGSKPTG